jgi:hypothetical protein
MGRTTARLQGPMAQPEHERRAIQGRIDMIMRLIGPDLLVTEDAI